MAIFAAGFSFCVPRPLPWIKEHKLELKVRYDNGYQTLSLDDAATETLWVILSVEDEALGKDEKSIQEAFEKQFNRPEYNDYHRENRRHYSLRDDDVDMWVYEGDPAFILEREQEESESDKVYQMIREHLKPEWAELFIAVRLEDKSIRDYAASIGVNENNLTKKLERAEKKLKKIFSKTSDFPSCRGY